MDIPSVTDNERWITKLVVSSLILVVNLEVGTSLEKCKYIHYENMPMQNTAIFNGSKNDNFQLIFFYYFHIFAQNIDCGYPHNLCFEQK